MSYKIIKPIIYVVLILSIMLSNVFAYYENVDKESVGYDRVVEIEAENYSTGNNVNIVKDSEFSNGQGVRIKTGETLSYPIEIEGNANNLVVYVVHKAESARGNLSFINMDYFESMPIYAEKPNKITETRLYFGSVLGKHILYLKTAREGHIIDKIIIKYNVTKGDKIKGVNYIQGNPEIENMDITEVKTKMTGTYFIEAEDGITNQFPKTTVVNEESCSQGAYICDAGSGEVTDPTKDNRLDAQFKFYVEEPGCYFLWARHYAKATSHRSSWFSVDNEPFVQLDTGTFGTWLWGKHQKSFYLDKGWHTLNVKHRQHDHRIDCMILTSLETYRPTGMGALPSEDSYLATSLELNKERIEASQKESKFRDGIFRLRSDEKFNSTGKNVFVPLNNLAQMINAEYELHDDYVVVKIGRKYLKVYPGEKRYISSGTPIYLTEEPYMVNSSCMFPIGAAKDALGFEYYYSADENSIFILEYPEENYRDAMPGEIECISEADDSGAFVKIPYPNPDAKVEVWLRINEDDEATLATSDYDNMYSVAKNGSNYYIGSIAESRKLKYIKWTKMSDTYYKDGAFWARRYEIFRGLYDFKVRIVDGNKEDVFVARKAFNSIDKNNNEMTKNANVTEQFIEYVGVKTNGELLGIPTFENVGLYIDADIPNMENCEFFYRKAGETDWKKGYKPFFDKDVSQFRGSIVNLTPDTKYEIKAIIYDTDNKAVLEKNSSVRTWSETPIIGKKLKLSDVYDGDGTLYLLDIEGSEDEWIEIDCEGQTIDAGVNNMEAVYIGHCKYIILKNAVIKGGSVHGVNINALSENIYIQNCDISGWGPGEGHFDEGLNTYYNNGEYYTLNAGIALYMTKNILIERCYIHDANQDTNPWRSDRSERENHPYGSTGIFSKNIRGAVIRYNYIIGSDDHRFNDVIEGFGNTGLYGAALGHDSDCYGNMLYGSNDDTIELDGAQMNVRLYGNRMEQTYVGISTAPTIVGPSYIFRNLVTNRGDEVGIYKNAIKAGGRKSVDDLHTGYNFVFNNTIINPEGNGMVNNGIGGTDDYHATTRNNIFIAKDASYYNKYADERDSNDYDMYNAGYFIKAGDGVHNLYKTYPVFVNEELGDYRLAETSPGIDVGEVLDNFGEEYSGAGMDIGAFERNGDLKFLPYVPCDFEANAYSITLKDGEEFELVVKMGKIEDAKTFSVVKNYDFDWIEITEPEGVQRNVEPNSEYAFKVSVNMGKCDFKKGNGMILFRLDNGYAIPITVTGVRGE